VKRVGRPPLPRTIKEPRPVTGARWIPLTKSTFALVDECDFNSIASKVWAYSHGYATRDAPYREGKYKIFMHHEVLGLGRSARIDHANGNSLDNRKQNLRVATQRQNLQNMSIRKDNTTGYKGVQWTPHTKRFRARIKVNSRVIHLGYFIKASDAGRAYDLAAKQYFGAFARGNGK
jgi:hypothetical protein